MAGFRNSFLNGIGNIAAMLPPQWLQKLSGQKLILPFYHLISDEDCPHIKHLYPVKRVKEFRKDLDFLLQYYKPIDYPTFRKIALGEKEVTEPSFLLSFDDGLSEFKNVIAPILLEKGIPAICFLNSDFIDNKKLFYRYKASLLIEELSKKPELEGKLSKHFNDNRDNKKQTLSIPYQQQNEIDQIASLINYDFDHYLQTKKPYLESQDIEALIKKGFYFGAHSKDHPQYQFIGLEEQISQTEESMRLIQNKFKLGYKAFSFPFTDYGVSHAFFEHINANQITDITFGSAGQKKENSKNHFHRIPFEGANFSARAIHNTELLYYCLKMPLGKNTIHRK